MKGLIDVFTNWKFCRSCVWCVFSGTQSFARGDTGNISYGPELNYEYSRITNGKATIF